MIKRLLIKNYAIIEALEIDFSKKLTVITGETGAGKSILLGALGLIMGRRADTKALYHDGKKCIIEAYFDVTHYNLIAFFEDNDIDYDDEVIIRREITPSGKSRSFINDTPVRLTILKRLTASLIDLHQQFDTLDIHNVSFQLRMIDSLAGNTDLLISYQKEYRQYQTDKKQLAKLIYQSEQAAKEMDFLKFQLSELAEAELDKNEQESLELEQQRLSNAEDIKRILHEAFNSISDSELAIISQLNGLSSSIGNISKYNPKLQKLKEQFDGLILELQDVAEEFGRLGEDTEYDEERIAEIQERLDLLYRLQHKHHVPNNEELLEIKESLEKKLDEFSDISSSIKKLEKSIDKQEKLLRKRASKLSTRRKAKISFFEKRVHGLLAQLSMQYARLKVDIKTTGELSLTGIDDVNFLFAPNKGSRFQLIKQVASGGELSRLTLCTKSLVASAIPLPTLIFDEIDSGISGDVALKMGHILRNLSDDHQVITITHTPQIAAQANKHFFIYKKVKGNRTSTNIKTLSNAERIQEIATMLSGNPPSPYAIENATELLGRKTAKLED